MSLSNTEKQVKDIRRKTRRKSSSEENVRIVLDGLRGEYSIAELCRRESINNNLYNLWSKDFQTSAMTGSNMSACITSPDYCLITVLVTSVVSSNDG